MLSPKQIGTICFAIFSILISAPLFATDIPSSASTADCKHTPLQVYSGTSNLEAGWEPNTIALHWYNGDDELTVPSASQSCVYDDSLTPPSTIPTKTGYTFRGWRVRQVACQIPSSLANKINPVYNGSGYGYKSDSTGSYGPRESNASTYGLTQDNTWAVEWSGGEIVHGRAICSGMAGDNANNIWDNDSSNWSATESQLTSASGEAKYCWCAATNYTPSGGSACYIAAPSWVFLYGSSSASACAALCAKSCAERVENTSLFRYALFGGQ